MWATRTNEKTATYATVQQSRMTSAWDVKSGFARSVTLFARPSPTRRAVIDIMRETRSDHVETTNATKPTCSPCHMSWPQITVCSMEILMMGRPSRGSFPYC